ncbi:zinc-dependent alcohol dehydrogenase family protein [Paraburkholderia acidisoli]|uniref:Zinc-binding dehydrogenase n=1 Tax=Paraburkholderia acidisoli TaxID=2571748 RepID=A0A7Z2GNR4_9BURK|nr:NAD(P)-dependent alcohol dehydrogenase [Paraburkholderia acidisoli]QGZ65191.1 zinc-binding dehydrogenase [Paraburkholderia acidisoli]
MQAFQLTAGETYRLQRSDLPTPAPRAGEVLVKLHAASLNYLDLMVARGRFGEIAPGFIPGTDGAGEIAALGECVEGWAVGERVIVGTFADWAAGPYTHEAGKRIRGVSMPGSLAQYAVVPVTALVRLPASLSYREAASLPIAATTAWNGLVAGAVRPGSTVALLGTGGVSLFALQLAKAAGARVLIASSSDAKLERARALGADDLVNYRTTPAWDEAMLAATGGRGADLVLETVGPATFQRSINVAAIGGTIFTLGFVSGMDVTFPVLAIMLKTLKIVGSQTGSTANLAEVTRAIAQSRIEPVIDRVFAFEETPQAYAYLQEAHHFGKVVVDIAAG